MIAGGISHFSTPFWQVYHNSHSQSETEKVRGASNGHQASPGEGNSRRRNTDSWQRPPSRERRRPRTSSHYEWFHQGTWSILFSIFTSLQNIYTQKSFRFVFLGRRFTERIYLLNFSGTALLTVILSIPKNLLFIINLKHNYYLHKIFYFSKIQLQYDSQHFLFDI